ncbi:hypothetical protein CUU95_18165 [Vreelandella alkaliphila]|nr:hypothetical protein CUU95_18165 [Halomonas alkaliphila]
MQNGDCFVAINGSAQTRSISIDESDLLFTRLAAVGGWGANTVSENVLIENHGMLIMPAPLTAAELETLTAI